jgi:cbb3-type cytochrome oxidase maturation protein
MFLAGFIWAARSGQFEDTETPSLRPLLDDEAAMDHGRSVLKNRDRKQA